MEVTRLDSQFDRSGKQVASDCRGGNHTGNALPPGGITLSLDVIFFAYLGFSRVENQKKRHSIDTFQHF